ncbi:MULTISPECIES: hypothetical protein [Sulfitobacter]|uniref:Uncharacterized protein n=1 Tax=Sulfitobacter profundi TaxID=2679961 RepID=A0ABW1Z485_9RHOB|nr:hypothetical protein [Sulfitobacter indolifex]
MVDPDRIGDDLAWEAVTFQAGHGGWRAHRKHLDSHETPNKLAMPFKELLRTPASIRLSGPKKSSLAPYLIGAGAAVTEE